MKQTEKDIQNSIIRLLKKHEIFHWRNNTGCMKVGNRIIRFGKVGSSDIFCFYKGMFTAIEVKSATGKPTDSQIEFMESINKQKYCSAFIARSKEDVKLAFNLK